MKEPKNSLVKQYTKMLALNGVELEFTDEALREIAKKSISLKTGARGLRSIVEKAMLDIMYDVPSDPDVDKVIVDSECVTQKLPPKILRKQIA